MSELTRTTSYYIAATALSDELSERFQIRLAQVVQRLTIQEGGGHLSFGYVYQIVAAARLAVLLGINIDIRDVPYPTRPVTLSAHKPAKPTARPAAATAEDGAAPTSKQVDKNAEATEGKSKDPTRPDTLRVEKPSEPATNRRAAPTRPDTSPAADTAPNCPGATSLLRELYSDAIKESAKSGKMPTRFTVRQQLVKFHK